MIIYSFKFLIYLFPLSLIIGPAISDINLTLIACLTIIYIVIKKDFFYFSGNLTIIFLIFFLLLIVSSINSHSKILSFEYSLFYSRFFLFSIGIYIALRNNFININHLIFVFTCIYFFLFVDGYYQYFTGYDFFNNKYDGDRLSSIFGEEKILGSFISRTFPLYFGLICMQKKNPLLLFISVIGFILSDVLIILSGDRTSAFYLLISCVIILILTKEYKIIRLVTLIISLILVVFIFTNTPMVKERIIDKTIDDMTKINPDENNSYNNIFNKFQFFTETHHNFMVVSLKIFNDNKIFGSGPKNYRVLCNDEKYLINKKPYCSSHPHNIYFQLLAETGLFATLIVLAGFFYVMFLFFRQFYSIILKRNFLFTDAHICFLTCLFITLFPFIPTGNFFGNWMNAIFYLPLGFLLNEIYKSKINNESSISN